jgi:hypothetical protein
MDNLFSTPVGWIAAFFLLILFGAALSALSSTSTPLSLTLSGFSAANICFSGALRNWRIPQIPLPQRLEWTRTWAQAVGAAVVGFFRRLGGLSPATVVTPG